MSGLAQTIGTPLATFQEWAAPKSGKLRGSAFPAQGNALAVVKRTCVMLKRIAVWIVSMCLVGVSGAVCQDECRSSSMVPVTHGTGSTVPAVHKSAQQEVPDAPSASAARKSEPVGTFRRESSLTPATPPPNLAVVYEPARAQKQPTDFLSKLLDPSVTRQPSRYRASSRDSLLGRATDAASSILVTRDESGNRRINTSYFVGVLTMVAAHRAEHPYWARSSASAPLGDFGSTVGNDAGMNLLHEFGPGMREAVAGHMPSFVFRIQKRIEREVSPQPPVQRPGR